MGTTSAPDSEDAPRPPADWPDGRLLCVFAATVLGLCLFSFLGSPMYWHSDDPIVLWQVRRISFGSWFLSPDALRSLGTGNALVPMFPCSLKLDTMFGGATPSVSYAHQIGSTVLAGLAVFVLFFRITTSRTLAFVCALAWVVAAPTGSTIHYISIRHYLEGLLFGVLAVLSAWPLFVSDELPSRRAMAVSAVCFHVAILYKEVLLILYPLFLFAALYRKRPLPAFIVALSGAAYIGYRAYAIGLDASYAGMPLPTLSTALDLLAKTPRMIAGGWLGYVAVAVALGVACAGAARQPAIRRPIALTVLLLLLSFVIVLPVAEPLRHSWSEPNFWNRGVFMIAFLLLTLAAIGLRALPRRAGVAAAAILVACMIPGCLANRAACVSEKILYEAEARAYIANPDKLLLSRLPAHWYLLGIHRLEYGETPLHYQPLSNPHGVPDWLYLSPERLRHYGTGYVVENGVLRESEEAFRTAVRESASRHAQDMPNESLAGDGPAE